MTCECCCHGHCELSVHAVGGALRGVSLDDKQREVDVSFPNVYERYFFGSSEICDEHIKSGILLDQRDGFYDVLMALETNFNLGEEGL